MREKVNPRLFAVISATLAILMLALLPISVRAPPAPPPSGASTCVGCSVGLVAPAVGATVQSTFYASFFVSNFTIANPGINGGYPTPLNNHGHLHVFLDNNYYTLWASASAIPFINVPTGTHTFRIELVNDTHAPYTPDINISRTVTVSAPSAETNASNAATFGIAATALSVIAVIISALVLMRVWRIKTP